MGPLAWAVCFRDNPSTPLEADMSMVSTDDGRGCVGKADRGSGLKSTGYGRFNQNLHYMVVPAAVDHISAPPNRAAPLVVVLLLVASVDLHPLDGSPRPQKRWSTSIERPSLAMLPGSPPPTLTPASQR
jgi:hypothetical protein